MTNGAITLIYQLLIPHPLSGAFGSPAEVKAYLLRVGAWPDGVRTERWRLGTGTPGYEVELEVSVPLPAVREETP